MFCLVLALLSLHARCSAAGWGGPSVEPKYSNVDKSVTGSAQFKEALSASVKLVIERDQYYVMKYKRMVSAKQYVIVKQGVSYRIIVEFSVEAPKPNTGIVAFPSLIRKELSLYQPQGEKIQAQAVGVVRTTDSSGCMYGSYCDVPTTSSDVQQAAKAVGERMKAKPGFVEIKSAQRNTNPFVVTYDLKLQVTVDGQASNVVASVYRNMQKSGNNYVVGSIASVPVTSPTARANNVMGRKGMTSGEVGLIAGISIVGVVAVGLCVVWARLLWTRKDFDAVRDQDVEQV